MIKLVRLGWILAFACTLATWPVTYLITSGAHDVYMINKFSDEDIELNKELDMPEKSDPEFTLKLIKIYGQPMLEEPQQVLCDNSQILRPKEDASIALLPVDKEKGENPWQVKTIFWIAARVFWVSFGVGVLIFLVWLIALKARKGDADAPPASTPAA